MSALTGEALDELRDRVIDDGRRRITARSAREITNVRHVALLKQARVSLERAVAAAHDGVPEEFVLTDLRETRGRFDEIAGARPEDEVLRTIFARFCIGK